MKKIDLGQTFQMIANIGVIGGIIFLGLEIQQNNEQLAAQSRYNYYQGRAAATLVFAQNGDMAEIALKSITGDALSPVESLRYGQLLSAALGTWEYEFGEYAAGRLSEEDFNPAVKRDLFERTGVQWRAAWNQHKVTAPRRFVEYMDENIANP